MAANFPTSNPSFTKKDYVNRETPLVADYNQALEEIEAIGSWILSTSPLNILRTDNTTEFTPTANYHPATKKYVDDNAGTGDMAKATYDTDNDGRVDVAEGIDDGTNSATAASIKDAVDKKHTQNTDQYLDFGGISQVAVADAKDAVTKKHSHSNLPLLETYTQTETNLADAVSKKHTQGTDTTLGTMTADINMNSHKITNLTDPTNDQDAVTKKYVDDSISGKANMVSNPIEDNLAGLTSTGDLKDIGKKVTDFVQNKNTEGTIYLKTVNNTLRYSTNDTNYIIVNTLTDTYGLEWNKTTDSYTRLNDAEGKTRSFFDNIYPWAGIRRCVLNDLGQIVAYYGESGFVENGSTGQVMVRIPKFYYRAESFTNGYRWYISPKPQGGFRVHPAFIRNGVEKDCIYISAYEGCLYDVSDSSYITNDAQVADFTVGTGDKLSSIANAKPCSGLTQNLTLPNSRILAHNRGSGWELQDFLTSSAIQLLYLIEYANFNSQAQIGRGVVDKTDDGSTNMAVNTGATSSLGNASGKASGTDGLVSVSYRGIENFWGNIWKWVDGLNIQADNKPWVADHSFASDTFTSPYTYLNGTLANTNGYAKDILFNSSIDYGFLPTVVGGSETSYLCDNYYQATGNRVAMLGGDWYDESDVGALYWNLGAASSYRSRTVGARLLYVP